jgi:hypothetical protein
MSAKEERTREATHKERVVDDLTLVELLLSLSLHRGEEAGVGGGTRFPATVAYERVSAAEGDEDLGW